MRVIIIEPHQKPRVERVTRVNLEYLQGVVGGSIEAVYPFDRPLVMYCNEDAKMDDLPFNRFLLSQDGRVLDCLAGTLIILGDDGKGGERDLTDEEIDFVKDYYKHDHGIICGKCVYAEYGVVSDSMCDSMQQMLYKM